MNIEEIRTFFKSVKERFSDKSNIHNLFDEVEEYINQQEADKLEAYKVIVDTSKVNLTVTINLDDCKVIPKDSRPKQDTEIKDKDLVWCWDKGGNWRYKKLLKFYDKINNSTFDSAKGTRNSIPYDNYEKYQGEYPEWAKEALKTLEE